ncbi:cmgc kinase [Fusarium longipes]|uniref:Cmgc kinase n=1 Tax=Fusarium longipes TaxID=694270 RepID=A0A395SGY8_9HYPO|nr:cmgc kinase [Fusarium longipes]
MSICHVGADQDNTISTLHYVPDFRPANILVKLSKLDHLSTDELLTLIGQPKQTKVRAKSGKDLPASSTRYLVLVADLSTLGNEFLTDDIRVIDIGESFKFTSPPEYLGMSENYLTPEVLLELPNEIREQLPLFYMIHGQDELLAEMVRFFGKFPDEWWAKWDARRKYLNDDGNWIRKYENWSLKVALGGLLEIFDAKRPPGSKPVKTVESSEVE